LSNQLHTRLQFTILLLGTAWFLLTLFQNSRRNHYAFSLVNHTNDVINVLDDLGTGVSDLESAVRGYVISNNKEFLNNYKEKVDTLHLFVSNVRQLTDDNPVQQKYIAELNNLFEAKLAFQDEVLRAYRKSQSNALALISTLRGKHHGDAIKVILGEMKKHEQLLLEQRINSMKHSTQTRLTFSVVAVIVAFLGISLALFKVSRANRLRGLAEARARQNEALYRAMVENSVVVMYQSRLDGQINYISNRTTQITGYEPAEIIGQQISFLVHPDFKEHVQQVYRRQIRSRIHETLLEFPILTKCGETRWVEQSMVLLTDNGMPTGFQSIVKDISAKKSTETALQEAEFLMKQRQEEYQFRIQAILDNIPMIVSIKDLQGRYLTVNRRFKEAFELNDEQILGKQTHDVFADEDMTKVLTALDQQVVAGGQPVEIEDLVATADGARFMQITKFPLIDRQNQVFAVCGINKDISDMVRSRQQLIDARLRAEKAERLQEEFLANMSHEIRTPMNGIIGMTNLLEESPLSNDQKEFVQLIKYSSNTLLALINDILDLSKIKASRMTVEAIGFSISEVIEEVVSTLRIKAAENKVTIDTQIDQRLPPFLSGDRHKLVQVLNNLVGNAVKFTTAGQVTVALQVMEQNNNNIRLRVDISDSGIGIAESQLEYIFESFTQTGNDMTRRFGGTGLGLAITKRLIELQGGTISVSSTIGKGSVFSFELNYLSADAATVDEAPESARLIDKSKLVGKKILLVEDNLINQMVTRLLLEKAGIVVTISDNGRMAIERLEANEQFDLIIMDLQMPEMNGMQATAYIRNKLKLNIPIIAMTASALRNERVRCLDMGMNEYITKPFVTSELFRHLYRILISGVETSSEPIATDKPTQTGILYSLVYLQELEDDHYLAETLQMLVQNTPTMLEEIRLAVLHENLEAVKAITHKLKSSLGIFQMNSMLALAVEIEQLAIEQREVDSLSSRTTELFQEYELVRPMLAAELVRLQPLS
jgi:PAS domain S-box-containing protein